MNFDFSPELEQLRDQARRFLAAHDARAQTRAALDGATAFPRQLWDAMAELGWQGVAVPEEYGGVGLGHEALCVLAEELGRAIAPVPFAPSVYLATEAILLAGTAGQKARLLPDLAGGRAIGCFAWGEGLGNPSAAPVTAAVRDGRITGEKWPVAGGSHATLLVTVAQDGAYGRSLFVVDLTGVARMAVKSIDPTGDLARIVLDGAPAERLGAPGAGDVLAERLQDRAAVLVAFEQIGGAAAALEMACGYARERHAFGRPIGSFQAIKHKLADVYIGNELARSNAYFGAWALAADAPDLPLAAATARVSASDAFHEAARENIQTHGGMGFTWAADCHLYYRRARHLAQLLGSAPHWKDRVVTALETRNAA